jgi:tetratricopeptide (TPR) repeat protein
MKGHRVARWILFAAALFVGFLFLSIGAGAQAPAPDSGKPAIPQSSATTPSPAPLDDEALASLHMARKEFAQAAALYKKLAERNPSNAIYLNMAGVAYLDQSELGTALRFFEKSAKLDRNYVTPINNMGVVHYMRRRYGKAIKEYKKALAMDPHGASAASTYINLGCALFDTKKYPEAMEAFQKALALDPKVMEHTGRTGSVAQDLSVGDRGLFHFMLAKAFAQAGNLDRCVFYLRKARDEGYASFSSVKTDPAFAAVVNDPAVLELIQPPAGSAKP